MTLLDNEQAASPVKRHSLTGMVSFWCGMALVFLFLILLLRPLSAYNGWDFEIPRSIVLISELLMWICGLVGLIAGIAAVFKKNTKKDYAYSGLLISGAFFLFVLYLWL